MNRKIIHQVRPYHKVLLTADPGIIKEASTRKNLVQGLKALDSLWKRGILHKDLESHFYFSWFAYSNGNLTDTAKLLGMHRNTLIYTFKNIFYTKNSWQLRKIWNGIRGREIPFSDKVKLLYDRGGLKPRFSKEENRGLVNLWLMGVPRKVVRSHYFIWSVRKGRRINEISKSLGQSTRTVLRFRKYALSPESPAKKWLKPLKVK